MLPGPPWQLRGCKKKCGGAHAQNTPSHPHFHIQDLVSQRNWGQITCTKNMHYICKSTKEIEQNLPQGLLGFKFRRVAYFEPKKIKTVSKIYITVIYYATFKCGRYNIFDIMQMGWLLIDDDSLVSSLETLCEKYTCDFVEAL